jgi:hypothetical protein
VVPSFLFFPYSLLSQQRQTLIAPVRFTNPGPPVRIIPR